MPGITQSRTPSDERELAELIRAAKAGDKMAFGQLMIIYVPSVWKMAAYHVGPEDADDAVQEIFLRVFKYLKGFDLSKPFAAWLHTITDHVCQDLNGKKQRMRVNFTELSDELSAGPPRQQQNILADERKKLLIEGMKQLPPKQRQAITLCGIEGLSSPEAAKMLGTDPATVRQNAAKALEKLTKFMTGAMYRVGKVKA